MYIHMHLCTHAHTQIQIHTTVPLIYYILYIKNFIYLHVFNLYFAHIYEIVIDSIIPSSFERQKTHLRNEHI